MPKIHRRVVTGHNAAGRSIILMDGESPNDFVAPSSGGLRSTELWATTTAPADNSGSPDAAIRERRITPEGSGTVFRYIEYPPDSVRLKTIDPAAHFSGMGARRDQGETRHKGMHRTDTVDYAIILSGEIYAVMDEGEVLLKQGDCLIQRGTNHAWSNRTEAPCLIAFVLVAAKPLP
ncbi:MAG: cupin [Rhodospirillales bacterium]|jgi:mannose-6-phosphate isomerase-like protein (cupin superfamily)|nr:cupin [Rhodospirillales bacterium]